jgi:hypothetical protein
MLLAWLWDIALRPLEWVAGAVAAIVALLPAAPDLPSLESAEAVVSAPGRLVVTALWCVHLEWLPKAALLLGGAWLIWWLTWRVIGLLRGGGDAK